MAAANLTTESPVLKTLYPSLVTREWFELMPLVGLATKKTDFKGANYVQAMRYTTTQGRSRQFNSALQNMGPVTTARFTVTRARDYSLFAIDGETIDAADDDKGAIVDEITLQVDGALDAINQSTARALYRNTGGAMGQITSGYNSATLTLTDANTVIFFQVGNNVGAATTDGTSGSLLAGSGIVGAVDFMAGTLTTLNGNAWNDATNIPGLTSTSYLFPDAGDFGQSLAGLNAWVPATAPTSGDSFFGKDRSQDPVHLAGIRTTGTSGAAPEEAIQKGLQQIRRFGGKPQLVMMNDADFTLLVLSLGSRVVYNTVENEAKIGFEGVKVVGPYGPVTVLPDPNCQQGVAWAIPQAKAIWRTLKEYPRFLDADKLGRFLREPTSDSYQGRIGGYGNFMTDSIGHFGRIAL